MTWEQEKQLRQDYDAKLTDEELAEGWHFCPEYDFDLMLRSDCGLCSRLDGRLDEPKDS